MRELEALEAWEAWINSKAADDANLKTAFIAGWDAMREAAAGVADDGFCHLPEEIAAAIRRM